MKATMSTLPAILIFLAVGQWPAAGSAQASENAAARQPAYCAAKQLEIRQIASDAPGMSHSNAFFAVLNHGSNPCALRAGAGLVWSNNTTPPLPEQLEPSSPSGSPPGNPDEADPASKKRYVLSPVPANGKVALKDIFGFAMANDGASGTGNALFSSISAQLPNAKGRPAGRVYKVPYDGYATSPIPKTRFGLEPFLRWGVLEIDSCQTTLGNGKPLAGVGAKGDIPARTIDIRRMLQCG